MNTAIASRIESLEKTLKSIAVSQAQSDEAEDIYSSMIEAIVTKAEETPEFINQKDAYIISFATWEAKHVAEKSRIYLRYVDEEGIITSDDGDEISTLDLIPSNNHQSVEDEIIERETLDELAKIIATMNTENQTVIKMLMVGCSKTEIAAKLGISKPAISQRIKTIGKTLATIDLEAL
jgi:RNA polymerase sigma factor (sigma-70 family)